MRQATACEGMTTAELAGLVQFYSNEIVNSEPGAVMTPRGLEVDHCASKLGPALDELRRRRLRPRGALVEIDRGGRRVAAYMVEERTHTVLVQLHDDGRIIERNIKKHRMARIRG